MNKLNRMIVMHLILVFALLFSVSFSGLCAEKVITWRLPSMASAGDFTYQSALRFADLVNEASDGRLVIKPFVSGAILPGGTEFEGAMSGAVEAAHTGPAWGLNYLPAGFIFGGFPGGLTTIQYTMWMDYEGKKLAREAYEPLGLVYVGDVTLHPPEVWAHSTKPIRSVNDLKGLKIRLGDAAVSKIFVKMGATPVFFPGGEVYEAIQRGIIDAGEYITPSVNWGMGFHEVAKYMYLSPTRCPMDNQSIFVNKKAWDSLPSDLKVIVECAAKKVAHEFFAEELVMDIKAVENFKAYGTIVEKLPKDVEDLLIEKSAEYFAEITANDPLYEKIYNSAMNYKKYCEEFGIR